MNFKAFPVFFPSMLFFEIPFYCIEYECPQEKVTYEEQPQKKPSFFGHFLSSFQLSKRGQSSHCVQGILQRPLFHFLIQSFFMLFLLNHNVSATSSCCVIFPIFVLSFCKLKMLLLIGNKTLGCKATRKYQIRYYSIIGKNTVRGGGRKLMDGAFVGKKVSKRVKDGWVTVPEKYVNIDNIKDHMMNLGCLTGTQGGVRSYRHNMFM